MDVDEAAELAGTKLAEALPRRWRHVRSVARRARWVAKELSLSDDLVAASREVCQGLPSTGGLLQQG